MKKHRHLTLKLLWLEWREDHPEGWGFTQFCTHYRTWLQVQSSEGPTKVPVSW